MSPSWYDLHLLDQTHVKLYTVEDASLLPLSPTAVKVMGLPGLMC